MDKRKARVVIIIASIMVAMAIIVGFVIRFNAVTSVFPGRIDRQDSVRIAVAYPVGSIDTSTSYWNGVSLATELLNASGGIDGRKLIVEKLDDEGSVTTGITIAQEIVRERSYDAVIGHWNSRVSIPAAAIYENGSMVMMTSASTTTELPMQGYQYVFQQIVDDSKIGRYMALYAARAGYTRVAICYAADAYGLGLANSFEDAARSNGISVVDRTTTLGNDSDVKRLVTKWKALDVQALFIADVLPQAGETIKRLRSAGLTAPLLGATGLDRASFISEVGSDAEGTVVPTLFDPRSSSPVVREFVTSYRKRYGHDPDVWSAQGYDAVNLLAYAIANAGSASAQDIAQVLHALKDWPGVTGRIGFDARGAITGQVISLKVVQNGRFRFLE